MSLMAMDMRSVFTMGMRPLAFNPNRAAPPARSRWRAAENRTFPDTFSATPEKTAQNSLVSISVRLRLMPRRLPLTVR
jgi:hypothetical protein